MASFFVPNLALRSLVLEYIEAKRQSGEAKKGCD